MSGPLPAPPAPPPRPLAGTGAPVALGALAALLLFANLGQPVLWADEGDTAVFARTITERGLPYAWDGRTFTDSDRGTRLTSGLLMVGTPWLPYYVAAASFALAGESVWSARAPFAALGVLAVLLSWRLVLRATGDRRAALASGLLLLASVQFLLYARQCRHYVLQLALVPAALLAFLRLREHPRDPWFVLAVAALFHTHPLTAGAMLMATGALSLLHPAFRDLRFAFWIRVPIVLALTLPWLALTRTAWQGISSPLAQASELGPRFGQFAIEASLAVPALGWIVLFALARRRLLAADRAWLALAGAVIAAHAALTPLLMGVVELWQFGLRYACGLLPVAAGVTGLLVARAARGPWALAGGIAFFGFTHLPGNTLWWSLAPAGAQPGPTSMALHLPGGGAGRILKTEWLGFPRELVAAEPGIVAHLIERLGREAGPDEILITNYCWEPLYFHTRLPQGLKVLPEYPIAPAARAAGLPEYVFGVEGARWLVWRWPWEGYQDYWFERVRSELEARGATLQRVAVLPDTQWENRPELHFHRFPGNAFVVPRDVALLRRNLRMEAVVFRILWP